MLGSERAEIGRERGLTGSREGRRESGRAGLAPIRAAGYAALHHSSPHLLHEGATIMERHVVHTDKVPPARVPLSQAIKVGGWVFASGQLGMDPKTGRLAEGGIRAGTRQVCENLKAVLEAAGSSLEKVAKVTIYMADLGELMV